MRLAKKWIDAGEPSKGMAGHDAYVLAVALLSRRPAMQPGYWLIFFDDHDRRPEVFTDEAAARKRFADISANWNAMLFSSAESNCRDNPALRQSEPKAGQAERLKVALLYVKDISDEAENIEDPTDSRRLILDRCADLRATLNVLSHDERPAPGMKLVPIEPTEEMIEAACKLMLHRIRRRVRDENDAPGIVEGLKETWRTLLAASPSVPSAEKGEG